MKWISTQQERIGGYLIQFELYEQAGKPPRQRFKCLAYHGPLLVAQKVAGSQGEARRECRAAYVAQEAKAAADAASARA